MGEVVVVDMEVEGDWVEDEDRLGSGEGKKERGVEVVVAVLEEGLRSARGLG